MVVVKLGQCGGGEAVVRRSSLEPEQRQFFVRPRSSFVVRRSSFVVLRSSFARTLQGYISAHILFFVGAPVVYVNIVICPGSISKYLCAIIVIWPGSIRKYCYLPR